MGSETKTEIEKVFDGYFSGIEAIYQYFGVERFATYDYCLGRVKNTTWAIGGRGPGVIDTVYWELPDEDCDAEYPEAMYSSRIDGIFRGKSFTLIFSPSGMGGSGNAHIFDNDKEVKGYQQV